SHFTHPTPTRTYTLSLHDALPICSTETSGRSCRRTASLATGRTRISGRPICGWTSGRGWRSAACSYPAIRSEVVWLRELTPLTRSEEHTSELQSRENLVCRLLLEK